MLFFLFIVKQIVFPPSLKPRVCFMSSSTLLHSNEFWLWTKIEEQMLTVKNYFINKKHTSLDSSTSHSFPCTVPWLRKWVIVAEYCVIWQRRMTFFFSSRLQNRRWNMYTRLEDALIGHPLFITAVLSGMVFTVVLWCGFSSVSLRTQAPSERYTAERHSWFRISLTTCSAVIFDVDQFGRVR